MGKIKLLFILALCFIGYKGFIAFKNFEIGVKERVENIEILAEIEEKEDRVIGLMMYLGDPLELKEHLLTKSKTKCLEMKKIAEETSFAYYECAEVDAIIIGGKIVEVISEVEVFE